MAVSFSGSVKAEICRAFPQKRCCAIAECFGIFLYGNSFGAGGIRIVTESKELAARLPKLLNKAFSFGFDQVPDIDAPGKLTFQISDCGKIATIMNAYGFGEYGALNLHVNLSVLEDECCKAAFLRGAFLAGGSVTDPAKDYHLELSTTHSSVSRETFALLQDTLGIAPKITGRAGGHILYLKQSDLISDILTYLGAHVAAMSIMETKLEKELNNKVNRRCNCDEANTSKVVEASQKQLAAIRVLRERGIADKLPQKLQQALELREANPESTLTELAAMTEPPISKPAMSHRLNKLIELAKEETP